MAKCILIVDDDRVANELTYHILQSNGYDVMIAQDGMEGLDALTKKTPDLILLDVQMPKLDGYGFIKQKTSTAAFSKIPVIVLSAMAKTEPLFRRYGVKAYLIKPLNTEELLNKLKTLLPD